MRRACRAALLLIPLAAGCGGASGNNPGERLTVFAAASLTEIFPTIDPRPRYSFAGSDELAAQIREGAKADVFAAASPKYPIELHREGLIERPRVFATNELVLIVPRDNPGGIRSVADLTRHGVKVVVGAPGVPVGDYARQALERVGAPEVLDRVVSEEQDVKGVVSKVALGEADAGFAYATDVKPVAGKVRVIELPERARPRVEYLIAVVKGSATPERARAFVAEVLGERGRAAFRRAGLGLP